MVFPLYIFLINYIYVSQIYSQNFKKIIIKYKALKAQLKEAREIYEQLLKEEEAQLQKEQTAKSKASALRAEISELISTTQNKSAPPPTTTTTIEVQSKSDQMADSKYDTGLSD